MVGLPKTAIQPVFVDLSFSQYAISVQPDLRTIQLSFFIGPLEFQLAVFMEFLPLTLFRPVFELPFCLDLAVFKAGFEGAVAFTVAASLPGFQLAILVEDLK